jgi:hypothetical protein
MGSTLTLLLTVLNTETLEIRKIAISIDNGHSLIGDYLYYREPDVHMAYSEVLPELNLGNGNLIVDVLEIDDVMCDCTKPVLKEAIKTAKAEGRLEACLREISRLHDVDCECLTCKEQRKENDSRK